VLQSEGVDAFDAVVVHPALDFVPLVKVREIEVRQVGAVSEVEAFWFIDPTNSQRIKGLAYLTSQSSGMRCHCTIHVWREELEFQILQGFCFLRVSSLTDSIFIQFGKSLFVIFRHCMTRFSF